MDGTTSGVMVKHRDFELISVLPTRNKAKKVAAKHRRHDFHTRVMELSPNDFAVLRRRKETVPVNHDKVCFSGKSTSSLTGMLRLIV
jgi:hypothetical protein